MHLYVLNASFNLISQKFSQEEGRIISILQVNQRPPRLGLGGRHWTWCWSSGAARALDRSQDMAERVVRLY